MVWQSGIDTNAHTYSMKEKGGTIAILGSGFNNIFPKSNIELYKDIIKNDGLVISEYEPNESSKSINFLKRNRIVSGLSLGVLVIEAKYRSGTSVTARIAKEQGKKVFTIPHEIWSSYGRGTNRLIKNGAILVTNINDIFNKLNLNYKDVKETETFNNELNFVIVKKDNVKIKREVSEKIVKNINDDIKFSDVKMEKIYNCITDKPSTINDIYIKTQESISEISRNLFLLELNGYILKVEGGYICNK